MTRIAGVGAAAAAAATAAAAAAVAAEGGRHFDLLGSQTTLCSNWFAFLISQLAFGRRAELGDVG